MTRDSDGVYHVAGDFTTAGTLALSDGYIFWDGYETWLAPTLALPSGPVIVRAVLADGLDIYLGFASGNEAGIPASISVDYTGTSDGYPVITVTRPASVGTFSLSSIGNALTGATLRFGYALSAGESLRIDTRPDNASIKSVLNGVTELKASALQEESAVDFGRFILVAGQTNAIKIAGTGAGVADVEISLEYQAEHWMSEGIDE
jgi:hypothetical protein